MDRKIIHIDMDAFYASVEQRDNPDLRGKPIIIGRRPEERGVVATASYEARKFGIHSAMSTSAALKLCKDLIIVEPNFSKYEQISGQLYNIYKDYTDIIEKVALDECYLDVTNSSSASLIAADIKNRIKNELSLTASAGVSVNKLLAKICSDYKKPDGLTVVPPNKVADFIKIIPINDINGVGEETCKKIKRLNLGTYCGDFYKYDLIKMIDYFGSFGEKLYYYIRGIDEREVISSHKLKSIGSEKTLKTDTDNINYIKTIIYEQLSEVTSRAGEENSKWKTITLKIKFADFIQITRSKSIPYYSNEFNLFHSMILKILESIDINKKIRLIGVTISGFERDTGEQFLF